jgi:hypothetical protein
MKKAIRTTALALTGAALLATALFAAPMEADAAPETFVIASNDGLADAQNALFFHTYAYVGDDYLADYGVPITNGAYLQADSFLKESSGRKSYGQDSD